MIETPLHHCYLITAGSVQGCAVSLGQQIKELFPDVAAARLSIDTETVDTLTIEMARGLSMRGQQKSTGETRCIIRGFDTATMEAQNALLKIIEEPAEGIHFFLVTPQPDQLLETIRSRSLYMDTVCENKISSAAAAVAEEFLSADTLPKRLAVVAKLETKHDLRSFVSSLADTDLPRKNPGFGTALEHVTDWGTDSGASIKLLRQYLAMELSRSPKSK